MTWPVVLSEGFIPIGRGGVDRPCFHGVELAARASEPGLIHDFAGAPANTEKRVLAEHVRARGCLLLDAQIQNPQLATLGVYEVTDEEYRPMLAAALKTSGGVGDRKG